MVQVSPAALARAVVMIIIDIMYYCIHSFNLGHGGIGSGGSGSVWGRVEGGNGC
jgi:hypothetical protein